MATDPDAGSWCPHVRRRPRFAPAGRHGQRHARRRGRGVRHLRSGSLRRRRRDGRADVRDVAARVHGGVAVLGGERDRRRRTSVGRHSAARCSSPPRNSVYGLTMAGDRRGRSPDPAARRAARRSTRPRRWPPPSRTPTRRASRSGSPASSIYVFWNLGTLVGGAGRDRRSTRRGSASTPPSRPAFVAIAVRRTCAPVAG